MSVWEIEAQSLKLDPNSAAKMKAAFGSTPGTGYFGPVGWLTAEVARLYREKNTPTYNLYSTDAPALDQPVKCPAHARPGVSVDGHLVIQDDVAGRWHDFELYKWPVQRRPDGTIDGTKINGGSSMPVGAEVVPHDGSLKHQGATAALMPLAQGPISPDEIANRLITHMLVFTAANLGPAPSGGNPFPSNSRSGYSSGNYGAWAGKSVSGHAPLGQALRMNSKASISSSAPEWEKILFQGLKDHGTACRDRSTDFSLHAFDDGGGGFSIDEWISVGVPFVKRADGTSSMTVKASHIPWNEMEFCIAPVREFSIAPVRDAS